MQTITGDLLQDSLLHLLYCALKEEKPALPTDLNWEALLQLANRQQVYNTVLPVLEKAAVLPPEQLQRWNDYRLTELQRTLYVNSQRQAVCADLEAQNIRYMFLKGLVLWALYPQTMMRQMSDNDILFDPDRRGDLAKIMRVHQFTLTVATDKSDDYYKEPNCLIEFHRRRWCGNMRCRTRIIPAATVCPRRIIICSLWAICTSTILWRAAAFDSFAICICCAPSSRR